MDFIRARAETFGIGVGYAVQDAVDLPAYAGSVNLRHGRVEPSPGATGAARRQRRPRHGRALMRRRPSRLAVTAVLRRCSASSSSSSCDRRRPTRASAALSVQELGELVANLTTRNNQLREEIRTLERQRDAVAPAPSSAATPRRSRSARTSTGSWAGPARWA